MHRSPLPISPPSTGQWSDSLQSILDQPPANFPQRIMAGGLVFSVVFGAWVWFGQIKEVGHAQGQLVPAGDVYKISSSEDGKVVKVLVQEGQTVQAGQALVKLDNQLAAVEVKRLEQALIAEQQQQRQMQALIDKTHQEAQVQQAIAASALQAQQAAVNQSAANVGMQHELLRQIRQDIVAYEARLQRLQPLRDQGAIAGDQLFEVEQSLRDRQRATTQSEGDLQQAQATTDQLQAEVAQKRAEAQQQSLELQQRLQQLLRDAEQLRADLAETAAHLHSAQLQMRQRTIYSPVTGLVSSLNVRHPGEVIQPEHVVAEIAPSNAPLVLNAQLPNQEAGFMTAGMAVQLKIDAYPYQDYGIVLGKVLSIAPDAKPNEQLGAAYQVRIGLNQSYIAVGDRHIPFKAGQTASAEIIIRQRRILDVLLDPIRQLQTGGLSL